MLGSLWAPLCQGKAVNQLLLLPMQPNGFGAQRPPCQSKGADSASPQPANRVLRGRPSDAVDVADPKIRTKFKEMLTAHRKFNYDVARWDCFASLTSDFLRADIIEADHDDTLYPYLATSIRLVVKHFPRELDYILRTQKLESNAIMNAIVIFP